MDNFCDSVFWDWNLTWYTDDPDLTPCFEDTVLVWIPSGFLFLFAAVDIIISCQSKAPSNSLNFLNISKFLLTGILLTKELFIQSYFAYIYYHGDKLGEVSSGGTIVIINLVDVTTPAIKAISYLLLIALQILHLNKGVRSSGVHFLFWFLSAVGETLTFRTLLRQGVPVDSGIEKTFIILHMVSYPLILLQFVLHFWADSSNKNGRFNSSSVRPPCPEDDASFASILSFSYFDKMAWTGFKRPIVFDDIWLSSVTACPEILNGDFEKYWEKSKLAAAQTRQRNCSVKSEDNLEPNHYTESSPLLPTVNHCKKNDDSAMSPVSIFPAVIKTIYKLFAFATLLRFIPDVLAFVSPQVIRLLINYVHGDEEHWKGYLYACLLVVVASVQVLMLNQSFYGVIKTAVKLRTILTSAIYKKALRLSRASKTNFTAGEIMNIISVDVEKIADLFPYINVTWVAPFQLIAAIYFLWKILGVSVLAGVGVMFLLVPINSFIVPKVRAHVLEQLKYKSMRAKKINEIITGIKILKLQGWENRFADQIKAIRRQEVVELKKIAICNSVSTFLEICSPYFVTLATFACYVLSDENNVLDASKIFVSLAFFNMTFEPLAWMPIGISRYIQAVVSFNRIDKFMNAEELDPKAVSHDSDYVHRIRIENGTFAWHDTTVLTGINLSIKQGALVAIVGPVGSGKTSLLNAMLGEMNKLSGVVNTYGSISFVSQQGWIPNGTVKDSIVFGGVYVAEKFDRVIEACALNPDLSVLPAGHNTEIGERGVNLSGGQRARVSLAMAVYRDSDIVLFDDPLSSVDAYVEEHIFFNVVGPHGMLKERTRVMTTNSINLLPQFDYIIVMKDGHVSETGTYQELIDKHGPFSEFLTAFSHPESGRTVKSEPKDCVEMSTESKRRHTLKSQSSCSCSYIDEQDQVDFTDSEESMSKPKKPRHGQLIMDEKSETKSVSWQVYVEYCRNAGWKLVFGTLVLFLLHQVFSVGGNLCLSSWSNASTFNKTITPARRNAYLEVYAGLGLLQACAIFLANLFMNFGSLNSAAALHSKMLSSVLHAPMSFFETTVVGRIVNRFSKDVDTIDNYLPLNIRWWLIPSFRAIAIIFVISYSTPMFVIVLVPIFLTFYVMQRFFIASSRQVKRLESVSRSPIYAHISETINGAATIRAYGDQNRFIAESDHKIETNQAYQYVINVANRWLAIRLELVAFLFIFFAALFAVIEKDSLSPGIVGLSLTYAVQISFSLKVLVRYVCDLSNNFIAVERIIEYLNIPQEAPWEFEDGQLSGSWPHEGNIDFDHYQTRYREELELVLKDVTASIKAGEKIGLVGRTGSGKSSLTLALFRIIEAAAGSINIDGKNISKLGLHDIRKRITIIPQDPCLFSGTLRFNVDPFDAFDDDSVWRALELSNLRNVVQSLPLGLQHVLSEGGENLSVGQRQLVCLARALLRKSKILIMDEATAAVDLEAEEIIRQTIRSEFKNSTVITIAHRLNNIMDSDRVMVIDQGDIIEFDRPQDLLTNPNSSFYRMAQAAQLI